MKNMGTVTVLSFKVQTSLKELGKYVRVKARELYVAAIEHNLEVTGPVYWIYQGMDGKPDTRFNLEIALPVYGEMKNTGSFQTGELPAFKCISIIHNGDWTEMYKSYSTIIGESFRNGYTLSQVSREIYINMDFVNPENNITEIQLGIN
jgi:effector-binding domain-containing protein